MNDLLDLPAIDAALVERKPDAVAEAPAKKMTLAELATQPLTRMEPDLLALVARYRNVAFDLKTPKGLTAMKAARHDLRENGRFAVQRLCATFKEDANAAKRAVEETAERLVAIVRPQEDDYTKAIDARDAEIEAEKAEKARLEAERVTKLQAGIAAIRAYVQHAAGLPAQRIAGGIAKLETMTFPAEQWAEFAVQAANAQCETLEALRRLHTAAVQAEADRAEAERLRKEAAERNRLDKIAQAQQAAPPATQPAPALYRPLQEAKTVTTGTMVADASTGEVLHTTEPIRPDDPDAAPPMTAEEMGAEKPDVQGAVGLDEVNPPASVHVDTSEQPTIKLGDLCTRLGFTMTEAFVRDTLKIAPAESKGRAVLIPTAALPGLRDELIARVRSVLA
ncbi:MAG: hypothetical protein Q8N17_26335 [Burkholderiaceae bacterium]|nr:hypothetical protein [Burkholderiaceae bacterium]